MNRSTLRSRLLPTLAVVAPLVLGVPPLRAAEAPAPEDPSEIAPGVFLVRGTFTPGSQPDGNSVVFAAPEGLVVVDTGRHPEHTAAIVELARSRSEPIAAVVNTHWHLDHIGGNPRVRAAFPDVVVHASPALAGAMTGFLARYREQLEELIEGAADEPEAQAPFRAELAILDAGSALAPDETVTASGERTLAGRTLRIGLETHAVTAGDLWLLDPETRVLAAGDLVTLPAPFFDTACPERWRAALDRLAETDFELLVPGHGEPMRRDAFESYRRAFGTLLDCAASAERSNEVCIDGWLRATGALVPESDRPLARSLLAYYLDASLLATAPDPVKRTELCGGVIGGSGGSGDSGG